MKSVKAACLVLLVGLTCVALALVAAAPGQQAPATQPSAVSGSGSNVPAPPSAATRPATGASAAAAISRSAEEPAAAQADLEGLSIRPPDPADEALARARNALRTLKQAQEVSEQEPLYQALDAEAVRTGRGRYPGSYGDPETAKWMMEARKAEAEQEQLLAKYAQTTDEKQRAEIKASLAKVLERQFDLQLQQREREVSQIEARVKKLREMIEKRKIARQTIVTGRLDQLLNEMDGMGWVAPTDAMPGRYGPRGPRPRYDPDAGPSPSAR